MALTEIFPNLKSCYSSQEILPGLQEIRGLQAFNWGHSRSLNTDLHRFTPYSILARRSCEASRRFPVRPPGDQRIASFQPSRRRACETPYLASSSFPIRRLHPPISDRAGANHPLPPLRQQLKASRIRGLEAFWRGHSRSTKSRIRSE